MAHLRPRSTGPRRQAGDVQGDQSGRAASGSAAPLSKKTPCFRGTPFSDATPVPPTRERQTAINPRKAHVASISRKLSGGVIGPPIAILADAAPALRSGRGRLNREPRDRQPLRHAQFRNRRDPRCRASHCCRGGGPPWVPPPDSVGRRPGQSRTPRAAMPLAGFPVGRWFGPARSRSIGTRTAISSGGASESSPMRAASPCQQFMQYDAGAGRDRGLQDAAEPHHAEGAREQCDSAPKARPEAGPKTRRAECCLSVPPETFQRT